MNTNAMRILRQIIELLNEKVAAYENLYMQKGCSQDELRDTKIAVLEAELRLSKEEY